MIEIVTIRQKRIFREDLQNNPNVLYLFGDNLKRVGLGGQAFEMRGEPNAFGIATKKSPSHFDEDYFEDSNECVAAVLKEFERLKEFLLTNSKYHTVVIPSDGLGTGLANLTEKAPKLLSLINSKLHSLGKGKF
jgi:hypothetical protein